MDHKFNNRLNGYDTHIIVVAREGGPVPVGIVNGDYSRANAIADDIGPSAYVWGNAPIIESADEIEL